MTAVDWIGAEAGPEGLRLWAFASGRVVAHNTLPLAPDVMPRDALATLVAENFPNAGRCPIFTCGLPGAAARALPCTPFTPQGLVADGRFVHLPQLVQASPCVAVPAGAALRLGGCLAADPGFDGVICLTGPESLWAEISAGEVVGVMAALSGAIVEAILASRWFSGAATAEIDLSAFDNDLAQALSRPERLVRMLAEARALPPAQARARLSAALIGAELAAARPWWLGRRVRVLGPNAGLYARALAAQGTPAAEGDAEAAMIAGFALAARGFVP